MITINDSRYTKLRKQQEKNLETISSSQKDAIIAQFNLMQTQLSFEYDRLNVCYLSALDDIKKNNMPASLYILWEDEYKLFLKNKECSLKRIDYDNQGTRKFWNWFLFILFIILLVA